jgi:hypothetical protein
MLAAEHLPKPEMTEQTSRSRLEDIGGHQRCLARQGIVVLKVFLHISWDEQRQRFLRRLNRPDKIWKFDAADIAERVLWDRYHVDYQRVIGATAAAQLLVARLLSDALTALKPQFPKPGAAAEQAADAARRQLEVER